MADTRPGTNPTIMPHLAYVTSMPIFDRGAPRVTPIAPTYPLGAQLTLSTNRWDSRFAIVDTAPTRAFVIGRANNPQRAAIVEAGAGVSPVTGLRLGVSFAHGAYVTASEFVPPASSDRNLTLVGVEGEFGIGYTRVSGEVIRDALDSGVGPQAAYEWFLQGTHAMSPRWFVAARTEGSSAPSPEPGVRPRTVLRVNEATVGFRLTPELTVKGSGLVRKGFTTTNSDLQAVGQLVWAHRWY